MVCGLCGGHRLPTHPIGWYAIIATRRRTGAASRARAGRGCAPMRPLVSNVRRSPKLWLAQPVDYSPSAGHPRFFPVPFYFNLWRQGRLAPLPFFLLILSSAGYLCFFFALFYIIPIAAKVVWSARARLARRGAGTTAVAGCGDEESSSTPPTRPAFLPICHRLSSAPCCGRACMRSCAVAASDPPLPPHSRLALLCVVIFT